MKTTVTTQGVDFLLNGTKVYADLAGTDPQSHGLLFNARFIQGIFDDKAGPQRYVRFGFSEWDADDQTDRLIAALPQWYEFGLRAFTVGIQGGGPCFTIENDTIDNNPFGPRGTDFDPAYAARLDRLIRAADEVGMVVIVSYFYGDQAKRLEDGRAVRNAVTTASRFLREGGHTNVIIEVANEMDINAFVPHPIVREPEGMGVLLDLARSESGGMLVGCSGGGGYRAKEVVQSSDVVLIHGNGCSRQRYYNLIRQCREWAPDKPIVCNEDSQAITQIPVATETHTSWGYYNNMTKQEPPTHWEILPGEDTFFALRMAAAVGIQKPVPAFEDQFYLQGFEPGMTYGGERWIRLASLYPERIDFVRFYRNENLYYTAYDDPFMVHFKTNWRQDGVTFQSPESWRAEIHLTDGSVVEKSASA